MRSLANPHMAAQTIAAIWGPYFYTRTDVFSYISSVVIYRYSEEVVWMDVGMEWWCVWNIFGCIVLGLIIRAIKEKWIFGYHLMVRGKKQRVSEVSLLLIECSATNLETIDWILIHFKSFCCGCYLADGTTNNGKYTSYFKRRSDR